MDDITLVFIVTFIGGLVASYFVQRSEKKYKRPEIDSSSNGAIRPKKPWLLLISSYSIFLAWILILGFLLIVILNKIIPFNILGIYIMYCIWASTGLGIIFISSSFFFRCNSCDRFLLHQSVLEPPYGKKVFGMTGWQSIVVSYIFKRKFQCMDCGQSYSLNEKHRN